MKRIARRLAAPFVAIAIALGLIGGMASPAAAFDWRAIQLGYEGPFQGTTAWLAINTNTGYDTCINLTWAPSGVYGGAVTAYVFDTQNPNASNRYLVTTVWDTTFGGTVPVCTDRPYDTTQSIVVMLSAYEKGGVSCTTQWRRYETAYPYSAIYFESSGVRNDTPVSACPINLAPYI